MISHEQLRAAVDNDQSMLAERADTTTRRLKTARAQRSRDYAYYNRAFRI